MFSRTILGTLVVLAAAGLLAQTIAVSKFPYTGVVVGKDVYVRAGPGEAHYPCAKLSYPAKVRVVGEANGWVEVRPPRTCFSLISKDYVRRDGNEGTVTGTHVRVRAGSEVMPARTDRIQTRLNVGDKVNILGELGDFYKIEPPAGVHLWISADYVKASGAEPLTTMPTQPAPPPTTTVVVPAPVVDVLAEERAQFQAAERDLNKEFEKPAAQRNLATLVDKYKAIKVSPDSPLMPWVKARLQYLQDEIAQAADAKVVEQLVREAETTRAKWAAEREKIQTEIPEVRRRRVYAVEGVLAPSGLFRGGATGPKRYVLSDPDRALIHAYLQCTTGVVELDQYEGSYVGVVGTPALDVGSGLYVVEVEQIVVLKAPATRPRPTTRPAATTRPAVTTQPAVTTRPAATTRPAVTTQPAATVSVVVLTPTTVPAPKVKVVELVKPKPVSKAPANPAKTDVQEPPKTGGSAKSLPTTGLPVAGPTTKPSSKSGVNPKEYE